MIHNITAPYSRKKKAQKHDFFLSGWSWDDPGFVPGISPGLSLGQARVFSLFYTVEARVCPRDKPSLSLGQSRGRRVTQRVYVKKVYVPFLLATYFGHLILGTVRKDYITELSWNHFWAP